MTNYDWNCKTVDAYPQDGDYTDVVYNVHWIVTGTSDSEGVTYSANSIGTQVLDTSGITDFIPFDELTNEQAVSWTKSAMGQEQVDSIEAGIQSEIDNLINPTSVTLTIGESE
jgi:hypothetical protein